MDGQFSNLLRLLKNGQKSYSFDAHFKQYFNTTMSRTYIRKYMAFKLVKQINPIGVMKTFTKPNFNLFMEERLTIPIKLREKRAMFIIRNSGIYGSWRHKKTFRKIFLSTDDLVFKG